MTLRSLLAFAVFAAVASPVSHAADRPQPPRTPFFALCMDTHDANKRTLTQQAEMLGELGYDGAAHLWLKDVPERLKTLGEHNLKLYQVYVRVNVAPGNPTYDPSLKDVVKLLKGRQTTLGLLVTGGKPSATEHDARAVEIVREIAALAAPHGVRVALYPHTNDWLENIADAVRVTKKVGRPNVGVMFNLCHWMKAQDEKDLAGTLKLAAPHLLCVTINGADTGLGRKGGWDRLIQPLGSGTFDVLALLKMLDKLGYTGPVGLQCYGIGGDARKHLAHSITAWRQIQKRLTQDRQ